MGSVNIDLHKGERDYRDISLSDVSAVKYLIMYRDKVDIYIDNEHDNNYDIAGNVQSLNQELICLYAQLDKLIEKCSLNGRQLDLINNLFRGNTIPDITRLDSSHTRAGANSMLESICRKIAKENHLEWLIYLYNNYYTTELKKCSKCSKGFPPLGDFYGIDKQNKDGLNSQCRKCRQKRHTKKA